MNETNTRTDTVPEPVASRRLVVTNGPITIRERIDGRAAVESVEPYFSRENLERLSAAITLYLSQPQDVRQPEAGR